MSELSEKLVKGKETLAVVGLGYVGMPLAVAFAKKCRVIGFDVNASKIEMYRKGEDPTGEVGGEAVRNSGVEFTCEASELRRARFIIVAVPTPINSDKTPDLAPVEGASTVVGKNLSKGATVVYESTVYPGVTEEVCVPILEKESGLVCGRDFKVGYSPERINPADKVHRLENIVKIVSGMDEETLKDVADVYSLVIDAGVHPVSSIRVAEAAKVAENSQRDINIAFVNELAKAFSKMDIDTNEVIDAMNTKWNALGFRPGLVGGHCIGVDPYYFIYRAEKLGCHSEIIAAGRRINESMAPFIADRTVSELSLAGVELKKAKVFVLGITFKENCPDTRNSKVVDIIGRLREYGIEPVTVDPVADANAEESIVRDISVVRDADAVIIAVAHREFIELSSEDYDKMFGARPYDRRVITDVKGKLNKKYFNAKGYRYISL